MLNKSPNDLLLQLRKQISALLVADQLRSKRARVKGHIALLDTGLRRYKRPMSMEEGSLRDYASGPLQVLGGYTTADLDI